MEFRKEAGSFEDALRRLHLEHCREVMYWKEQCSSEREIVNGAVPKRAASAGEDPASENGTNLAFANLAAIARKNETSKQVSYTAANLDGTSSADGGDYMSSPSILDALTKSRSLITPISNYSRLNTRSISDMHAVTSLPGWLEHDVACITASADIRTSRATDSICCSARIFAEVMGVDKSVFDRGSALGQAVSETLAFRDRCKAIVESVWFLKVSSAFVLLNSLVVGVRTHMLAKQPENSDRPFFTLCDRVFAFYFFVEICLRFVAEGSRADFFYYSTHARWNAFDLCLSSIDVSDLITEIASGGRQASIANFAVMRAVRMLRVCRAFRILRLFAQLKELRIMVLSLMLCGRSLLWSAVMLSTVVYLVSVYIISMTSHHLSNGWEDTELHRDLKTYCDGLPVLMYYLFQAMTGGLNWGILSDILMKIDPANGVGMIFFIFFTMFALLNIITGIVVDSVLNNARSDTDEVINEQLLDDDSALKRLKTVFEAADTTKSGLLTYSQFVDMMNDGRTRALMSSVGLKVTKIRGLFKLMDLDNSGSLSTDEFLLQCMRLRGPAKAVDLVSLMYENKKIMNHFQKFSRTIEDMARHTHLNQHVILASVHNLREALEHVIRQDSNTALAKARPPPQWL